MGRFNLQVDFSHMIFSILSSRCACSFHLAALAFLLLTLLLAPLPARALPLVGGSGSLDAGETAGARIADVRVLGAQRIEPETVKSHLLLVAGDRFDATAIRNSLKALYDTGFFKDVSLVREGDSLVVRVVENPMINEVAFDGSDAFGQEELEKMVSVKSRSLYNRAAIERDLAALRQGFRIKGLFLAKIDVELTPLENNQIDLLYRIREGEKSKVREVRILGNSGLSTDELTKELLIQPTDWLSWYTDNDTYDREKLLFDQAQLRNVYLDSGYARVRVDSSVAELTPDRSAFVVTHTVHEGKRYRIGAVKIDGDFDELPETDLYAAMEISEGVWYSRKKIRQSIEKLTDLVGDFGYAFLDIRPDTTIDDDREAVDVHLRITKGRRVYVNRIEATGNTRTRDEVIRREMTLTEGDRFSSSQVRKAKKRLEALDFFEEVQITTPAADDPDQVNVAINVSEKPTGTFTVGVGYSSQDSLIGTANISQNNFLGKGQRLALSASLSGRRNDYSVGFTEPYFMGKRLSAGFDIYNQESDRTAFTTFQYSTFGGALRLGFPISAHLSDSLSYRFAYVEITDVGLSPSLSLLEQSRESPYLQSMVSNTLAWNDVDSAIFPTRGRTHRLTTDLSGLGGDINFARLLTEHQIYFPLTRDNLWVGHLKARLGVIDGLGESVPVFERYYLGGSRSVRGFSNSGIGPRTQDLLPFGGTHFEQANAELFFPIPGLADKGLRGLIFTDVGYLSDWDLPSDIIATNGVRVSAGVGLYWNSPFGPMQVSLGTALVKDDLDDTDTFDFTMGASM